MTKRLLRLRKRKRVLRFLFFFVFAFLFAFLSRAFCCVKRKVNAASSGRSAIGLATAAAKFAGVRSSESGFKAPDDGHGSAAPSAPTSTERQRRQR